MYERGKCRVIRYHDWEIVISGPEGQKERCLGCGQVNVWQLYKGKLMKSSQYHEAHIRDFAQPVGPSEKVFALLYGKEPIWQEERRLAREAGREKRKEDLDHEFTKYIKDGSKTTFL